MLKSIEIVVPSPTLLLIFMPVIFEFFMKNPPIASGSRGCTLCNLHFNNIGMACNDGIILCTTVMGCAAAKTAPQVEAQSQY